MSPKNSNEQSSDLQAIRIGNTKFYLDSDDQILNQNHELLGHETSVQARGEMLFELVSILHDIESNLQ